MKSIPIAVRTLLILNTVAFVLQQFFGSWMLSNLALSAHPVWADFQFWRLATYLFLHGSFFHLLFNLFALWMFGKELEYQWGAKEFIKFYFTCGLGAGILNILVGPMSYVPTIGSSGAIYGVLIAFAMLFPELVVYLYGIIPIKSRNFVILIAAIEFLSGLKYASSTVAHFAHLGGMGVGYLYLKSYEFRSVFRRFYTKAIDSLVTRPPKKTKSSKRTTVNVTIRKKNAAVTPENLDAEVDRILEKISAQGVQGLTASELKTLEIYSSQKKMHH